MRMVFAMYAKGHSYDDIIAALNGAKGKRGRPIGKNSLHYLLKNERYTGTYTWNARYRKIMRKWAGGKPNPNCVRIEDRLPQVIDEDTWMEVCKRMADNKHNARNTAKRDYLLSGLIECSKCGSSYAGNTSKSKKGHEYVSYICSNKKRTHSCDAGNIPARDVEGFVIDAVDEYLQAANYDAVADEIMRQYNGASDGLEKERAELAQLTIEISNGIKYIQPGKKFPELEDEINRRRMRKGELEDIIAAVSEKPAVALDRNTILANLKRYAAAWRDEGRKKEVIQSLVQKIYSNADGSLTVHIGVVHKDGCGGGI